MIYSVCLPAFIYDPFAPQHTCIDILDLGVSAVAIQIEFYLPIQYRYLTWMSTSFTTSQYAVSCPFHDAEVAYID